jgi:hypothetical protein
MKFPSFSYVLYFSQNCTKEERRFLSQDINCVGRDSNPGYNDYESKALPLDQWFSIFVRPGRGPAVEEHCTRPSFLVAYFSTLFV